MHGINTVMINRIALLVSLVAIQGCAHDQSDLGGFFKRGFASGGAVSEAPPSAAPVKITYCAECLIAADGRVMESSDKLAGDLEGADAEGNMIRLRGWAADLSTGKPASQVVVISDGEIISASPLLLPRPDISSQLNAYPAINFGYEVRIEASLVKNRTAIWIVGDDGKAAKIKKIINR